MDLVKLAEVVPAGTSVIVAWPFETITPDADVLEAAALEIGEPFKMAYLDDAKYHYQGVKLASNMTGLEISNHFMYATAGNAPAIFAVGPEWSAVLENEKTAGELIEDVKDTLSNVKDAASFGANLPRYLLIGGLVLGGLLIVGAGVWYIARKK